MKSKMLALLIALTMLLSTFIPVVQVKASGSPSQGGLWHLDEGAGTVAYDSSGNGNGGTIYGATWTSGKYGKALSFDGLNNYVEVPDSASLDITGKITIEAWICPRSLTGLQVIVSKYNHTCLSSSYYLSLGGTLGTVTYLNKIYFVLSYDGNHYYAMVSNTNITANTWTHVIATSNSTHMAIYINGVEDKVRTYPPGTIYASNSTLRIGCYLPEFGYSRLFNGTIDEVKVSPGVVWTVDDDRVECPNADFTSIQAAINASTSGDTIIVHDGTYNEALYIGKSLEIEAASTPIIRGGEMRVTNYGNRQATIFVEDTANVVLEGLDVEGQGLGVPAGTKSYAILYENSSGAVQDCTVSPNTVGDMYSNAVAAWDNSNVAIKRCVVENFGRIGVYSNNATLTVQDNTIVGQAYSLDDQVNYGIEIEDYSGASVAQITNNEISNCDNTNSTPLWSSAAIIVDTWKNWYDLPSSTVSFENNNIHNNFEAVEVTANALSYAHYNDIHDNRYGVWVDPDLYGNNVTFDARFNWWGDASGPNQATTNPGGIGNDAGDYVDYSPWLGATFEATPRTYNVNPTGTIQEAIDEASSGDTVLVHDGTYREALYICKSIALKAASSPIIEAPDNVPLREWTGPSGTQRTQPIILADGSIYVTVEGFTIDGRGVGNANSQAFTGIQYFGASGVIRDNTIKAIRDTPLSGVQSGLGILVNHLWDQYQAHSVIISNNTVFDYQKNGITCNEAGTVATVTENTVTGCGLTGLIAQNGIQFGWNATGTIAGNSVSGHEYTPNTIWWATGLALGPYSDGTSITGNNITGNDVGIDIDASGGVEAHYNNIYGNRLYGVYNAYDTPSSVVNATNNWWGDQTGPYHNTTWIYLGAPYGPHYGLGDNVSDYVLYYPWLNGLNGEPVQPPTASFTYSPPTPKAGDTVTFDASGSNANGGTITQYAWDFGDGNTTTTSNALITHVYASPSTYNVTLTVTNSKDLTDSTWQTITILPAITIVHDVAVTNVTLPFDRAYQGWVVNITVTVANLGNATESFTVTLNYDNNTIGTQPVVNLAPNATMTLLFSWNTTTVPYCHYYNITAITSTVPGETNVDNNQLSGGQIKIRIMGDINGDGVVNMKDVATAVEAFNSFPGSPRWNSDCDLNQDGIVNMKDIAIIVLNFNKHC